MARQWVVTWFILLPSLLGAGPPVVKSAASAPEFDALFDRVDGWIGADDAYSVAISTTTTRTLWLFSDTWVGKIRDGRRTDATIVNNSVGIQTAVNERVNFMIARDSEDKPTALIVPSDGRGWFWLQAGTVDQDRLWLFLNQVERTGDSVFGFSSIGLWLGSTANVEASPEQWRIEQVKMPNTVFTDDRMLVWGAAVLRIDDDLYVYGTDERRGQGTPDRRMVIARVPAASIGSFSTWRYFRDGVWGEDYRHVSSLAGEMASEYSVTQLGNRYIAIYTERGLSPRIMGRMAEYPWGPWSTPAVLYNCPEMGRDKSVFCYGAKAHPGLSSGHDLVVSYVVNAFDFWQVAREARLYWPRFVRVTLAPSE
jgi:hypothetical protein